MDLRPAWLKKSVYFYYYAVLHSSLKAKTKPEMLTDTAWSTDNNKASIWVSARSLLQGGSVPNSLLPHYHPATMNFACPVRLCTLKAFACRYQNQRTQRETEKRLEVLPWFPEILEPNIILFEGIKISFYYSRRLFLVLMFLNIPATNCDTEKKNSDWHFWFPPCLPEFQLVK